MADAGCCVRIYELTFQLVSVKGTLTRAVAAYRVTQYDAGTGAPAITVGETGQLRLRNGIVKNTLTDDSFCGGVAWGASRDGGCGA